MKKTTLAAVAVVAVLIAGVLLLLNYGLTPNPHVEITSFNTTGTSSGSSIGVVNEWFSLNLTNIGTSNVENLTITFSTNTTIESKQQLIYTNSTPPYDHIAEFEIGEPCPLGDVKAGETKDLMFYWAVRIDSYVPPLTATLKSNQATLDHATTTIPPLPNVKITNFIYLGVWHGTRLGGLLDLFSLSYANLGMTDIKDLTITLNTSKTNAKDTVPQYPTPTPIPGYNPYYLLDETINGETYSIEDLKAKETKNLREVVS